MDYGSGIWGYGENCNIEKIHQRIMRCFLGVNRYGTKAGIKGDLGWVNPNIEMLRLWNGLVAMDNDRLPKRVFDKLKDINGTWVQNVKAIFTEIRCTHVFDNNIPIVNFKEFTRYARNELVSHHKSLWLDTIHSKAKLHMYVVFKKEYETENYCTVNLKICSQ